MKNPNRFNYKYDGGQDYRTSDIDYFYEEELEEVNH